MDAIRGLIYTAILLGGFVLSAAGLFKTLLALGFPEWFVICLSLPVGGCVGLILQILAVTAGMRLGSKDWTKSDQHRENMAMARSAALFAIIVTAIAIPAQLSVGLLAAGTWIEAAAVISITAVATWAISRYWARREARPEKA